MQIALAALPAPRYPALFAETAHGLLTRRPPEGRLFEEKGLPFPPNSGYMCGSSERLNFWAETIGSRVLFALKTAGFVVNPLNCERVKKVVDEKKSGCISRHFAGARALRQRPSEAPVSSCLTS
jgi:hypothetical protein